MANKLFPRLPLHVCLSIHQQLAELDEPASLEAFSSIQHRSMIFTQTGGTRCHESELRQLKSDIEGIARSAGYPEPGTRESRAEFDTQVTIYFGEKLNIPLGELLKEEVWMFMSAVLLPHLVKWRFSSFNVERMKGGARNTFQRLWERAYFLDRGEGHLERWKLIESLNEDAFTAILERPTLTADPSFARAIGEAWFVTAATVGAKKMEPIHRKAILNLRARFPVLNYSALEDSLLQASVLVEFQKVAENEKPNIIRKIFG